ncbi:uncharacterized protein LOC144912401 isoform X1 [Branchiostoma floridae x Branchiostoma belcheri]
MAAQQPRFPAVQDVERQQQTPPPPQHVGQQRAPGLQQGPQQQGLQQQAPLPQGQLPVGGAHVAPQQAQLPTAQNESWTTPTIKDFEFRYVFDPFEAFKKHLLKEVLWISKSKVKTMLVSPSPEEVSAGRLKASADSLLFRDPDTFRAGEIHRHKESWQAIIGEDQKSLMVKNWIENGVSLFDFIQPFTGRYKGESYHLSAFPPSRYFPNLPSCEPFAEFVSMSIRDRIETGAVTIWGRVGAVPPPYLVMPLTVEPSKPRLCHDLRYLNLWMKDCPFKLDSIVDLTRYVGKGHYQTKCDDKSGYDHVFITEGSKPLVGFQWGGFWYVSATIPFGWSGSAFVYQTIGNVAMSRIRELGVPSTLYIDDRHAAQLASRNQVQRVETMEVEESSEPDYEAAQAACFILCSVLIGLGFFIGIDKSQLDPVQSLDFLGLTADSLLLAFRVPKRKRNAVTDLREDILRRDEVPIVVLQKLAGKLVSFGLAVPAARLYCREIFEAVKQAQRKGALVPIQGNLKEQLEHWRFLDTWEGHVPWRAEKREVVTLSSDASGFRWGGSWTTEEHSVQCGDYWQQRERQNIIAVKETEALRRVLLSAEALVRNKKVDARVDNMNLIAAWHNQGGRSIDLSRAIVKLWETVMEYNVDLNLIFVPSKENEADAPSRRVSGSDVKLHEELFQRIDEELGGPSGFDTDLMALPSNVQTGRDGKKLKFFSRDPAPGSCGVNVFAQNLTGRNCYVYPPFAVIAPLLRFLMTEQQGSRVVIVVPDLRPKKYWWPLLTRKAKMGMKVACAGQPVLWFPTRKEGWSLRQTTWDLWAFLL